MAIPLTAAIQSQISSKRIQTTTTFKINGVDRTDYLINYEYGYDKSFGSASASFTLNNAGGIFGDGGLYQIFVGDVVEISQYYEGDSTEFKKFYGLVEQRGISKTFDGRTITLTCLDYVSVLQKIDIDLTVEGTRVKISEEKLQPQYLPSPNESLAQVYNFANSQIAQVPPPVIVIRPQASTTLVGESPQFDGFEIKYANGQLVLGTPLNALYNYDVYSTYYFYTNGVYAEDIIEQILTQEDGYGKFLFGEETAQAVIDNHLTTTYYDLEGSSNDDNLLPNFTSTNITIKTLLTAEFDPEASGAGGTTLNVESTEGFPSSGTGSVNGDVFTWTGKTSTTLTGVSGLTEKPEDSYASYEATYSAGQVWYLKYSNITGALNASSIDTLPSGVTVSYVDKRFGRFILSAAISTSTNLTYTEDYTFKTLQATGVSLNRVSFNHREVANRFEAINKLRNYLAPNYIVRTIGDDKIWSTYLSQRTIEDYTLTLVKAIQYLEDEDLYTRVNFYGKNVNPNNIMFNDGVQFVSTDQEFKAVASQSELLWEKEEGNYNVYKTTITDAGRIDLSLIKPTVYINNVPVNDKPQVISQMPVVIVQTNRTETETTKKFSRPADVSVRQYFYYKIRFAHTSIDPSQTITVYDALGVATVTIPPYSGEMDYASGIYHVPGTSQNGSVEQSSTASYTVFYASSGISIDADTVRFKVSKQLVPSKDLAIVAATFQYWTALTPFDDVGSVIDGRYETQVQTEFFAEPPNGLPYAILDLGQEQEIQAIDFVAGFYKPDEIRKFDVNFKISLQYSLDNIEFFDISSETQNIEFSGGSSVSFEEDSLGVGFTARYLRVNIEDVKKIDYGKGVWVVAFSEVSAYNNVVLKGEAKLIPATLLASDITAASTTIDVSSTEGFTEPASGETATAFVEDDSFTYTGLTATQFTGVTDLTDSHTSGVRVSQTLNGDTDIYDYDGVLNHLGDRLYKDIRISDDFLYDQDQLNRLARAYLEEFLKDHSKLTVDVMYCPYLQVGQTVALTDPYNDKNSDLYFIESISDSNGDVSLTLAKYPA